MSYVMAGALTGLLMASVTVALGPIMLFFLAKDPSPFFRALVDRVPPIYMTMGVVVLAYPAWTIIGAVAGLLYRVSSTEAPGGGIGSPNLVFTLAMVIMAFIMAAPLALLLRQVLAGVAVMTVIFAAVFGWLLPFLAS